MSEKEYIERGKVDVFISYEDYTEDNYAFLTVRNELGDFVYIRFSYHAFVRMCEREGMTLNDFFINEFVRKAESSVFLLEYKDEQILPLDFASEISYHNCK